MQNYILLSEDLPAEGEQTDGQKPREYEGTFEDCGSRLPMSCDCFSGPPCFSHVMVCVDYIGVPSYSSLYSPNLLAQRPVWVDGPLTTEKLECRQKSKKRLEMKGAFLNIHYLGYKQDKRQCFKTLCPRLICRHWWNANAMEAFAVFLPSLLKWYHRLAFYEHSTVSTYHFRYWKLQSTAKFRMPWFSVHLN